MAGLRLPQNCLTALRRNCWRQQLSRQQDCLQLAVRPNAVAAAAVRWETHRKAGLVVHSLHRHHRSSLALVVSIALASISMFDTLQTTWGPL